MFAIMGDLQETTHLNKNIQAFSMNEQKGKMADEKERESRD